MEKHTWSTAEVAVMTGLTSRTLRHYHAIDLVRPASVGHGGLRRYGAEELLRLQEVLVLRELGLRLDVVARVLSGEHDRVEALRGHEAALREQATRTERLADTVARTLAHLEGGTTMSEDDTAAMFEGFEDRAQRVAAYEEELVAAHGEAVRESFRQAEQRTAGWGEQDYAAASTRQDALDEQAVALVRAGADPGSSAAQALVADHHAELVRYWTPDRASYTGLGRTYVEDPRRERYDAKHPALAGFWRDAIAVWAEHELG